MKSGKVLVSVVMSVYNDEQYLKESLDSIFAQTIQDFELIIVDDCSTDRTVEIIESYHDDRIRLICNSENRGLTRNLNTGRSNMCRALISPGWMATIRADRNGLKNRSHIWNSIRS